MDSMRRQGKQDQISKLLRRAVNQINEIFFGEGRQVSRNDATTATAEWSLHYMIASPVFSPRS
jgi:hypothetical protein